MLGSLIFMSILENELLKPLHSMSIRLLIILVLLPYLSIAQEDSLRFALEQADSEKVKAAIHIQLYEHLLDTDTIEAKRHLSKAHEISENIKDAYFLGKIFHLKGNFSNDKFQLDSTIFYYSKSLDFYQKTDSLRSYLSCKYDMSKVYTARDQRSKAIVIGYEILKGYEDLQDTAMMAKALNNIAVSYDYLSEHETALKLYSKALEYYIILDDKSGQASEIFNMAGIYGDDGDTQRAIDEYQKAIEIILLLDNPKLLSMAYSNLGLTYLNINLEKSEPLLLKALKIAEDNNNIISQGFANQNLAKLYLMSKSYDKAERKALKTLKIGKETNFTQLIINSSDYLSDIYFQTGKYKKSIQYLKMSEAIQDSIYTKENAQIIQDLQTKYETSKKEAENSLLRKDAELQAADIKKQNAFIFYILLGLLGVIVAVIIFYRLSVVRKKLVNELSDKNKEIEEQSRALRELDTFKSRFFANVSHDLRTPLTLIRARVKQIQEDDSSFYSNKVELALEKLQHDNAQLLSYADDIRQLIALEQGKLSLQYSKVFPQNYFSTIFKMFSSYADMRNVKYSYSSELNEAYYMHMDVSNMQKVMYNLISNAFKFTPKEASITISLKQAAEGINIQVIDTGLGIPADKQKLIFERYYQADNEYANKQGLGIGLSLVQEIIELHHGNISVNSTPNQGTTFSIYIPSNLDQAISTNASTSYEYLLEKKENLQEEELNTGLEENPILKFNESPTAENTLLIVDDHAEIRDYISGLLVDNYKIIQAINGKHALQVLNKYKVNLILTDLMMPWMDGYDFIKALKEDVALNSIPVMVVSARVSDIDKNKVLEQGVNNFLSKPFDPKELQLRIHNLIHQKGSSAPTVSLKTKDGLDEIKSSALKKLNDYILNNLDKYKISSDELAEELLTSKRNLYRLIRELTGKTPLEYYKDIRFQFVHEKLKNREINALGEAAAQVGMKNVTTFKKEFIERFGKDPNVILAE